MILFWKIWPWTRLYIPGQQIPKYGALKNYGELSDWEMYTYKIWGNNDFSYDEYCECESLILL